MKNTLWIILAAGALAAGPALAQAQNMGTPPHALGSPAPAPVSTAPPAHAKARMPHGAGDNPAAQRATNALNLLESHGYPSFTDFAPDGTNFSATVPDSEGKPVKVSINPDTGDIKGP